MNFTDPAQKRLVLKPILHPNLWKIFKEQQSVLWTTEEIDWQNDKKDFAKLSTDGRNFLLQIIAFFASSDMLVIDNLMDQFMSEVTVAECRTFYTLQAYVETIHSETYATALEIFAPAEQKDKLFNAIEQEPTIKAKGDYATKYMDARRPFWQRIWAFAIFEGVLFSASFASLYWLRTKDLCKGLTFSNELIQRDEGLHAKFAVEMLNMIPQIDQEIVQNILKEAIEIEIAFVKAALPQNLVGLSTKDMCEYVRYCGDRLVGMLNKGIAPIYNATQPLGFMEMISIDAKTNFFERRVSEYSMSGVGQTAEANSFSMDATF
jgi:ribonucleotide reductase beta subunit family protein with ferritin-like domain|tara:strand:- start:156 stop:1115 length:960 start_codon:yes stop_codon:yes gene_type:complete